MKLAERQALFFRAARGQVPRASLDAAFVGRAALSGADRMRIYNHAYFARLEAVLSDAFPVTEGVLGAARFVDVARRYVMATPAPHAEIERVGEGFPAFLAERDARRALADLAALEWARVAALMSAHAGSREACPHSLPTRWPRCASAGRRRCPCTSCAAERRGPSGSTVPRPSRPTPRA
jgi:hypothetical protein